MWNVTNFSFAIHATCYKKFQNSFWPLVLFLLFALRVYGDDRQTKKGRIARSNMCSLTCTKVGTCSSLLPVLKNGKARIPVMLHSSVVPRFASAWQSWMDWFHVLLRLRKSSPLLHYCESVALTPINMSAHRHYRPEWFLFLTWWTIDSSAEQSPTPSSSCATIVAPTIILDGTIGRVRNIGWPHLIYTKIYGLSLQI